MCIAIYTPPNKFIEEEVLHNCWTSNDDGAGLLFAYDGILYAHKELNNFNAFYDYYKAMFDLFGKKTAFVLHFRIRTHGLVNSDNCHPYFVTEELAFVHNGILNLKPPLKSDMSDTAYFNDIILKRLPPGFLESPGIHDLLGLYCSGNKLVFMDNTGHVTIINKHLGEEADGVWYSNASYKSRIYCAPYGTSDPFDAYNRNKYSMYNWGKQINSISSVDCRSESVKKNCDEINGSYDEFSWVNDFYQQEKTSILPTYELKPQYCEWCNEQLESEEEIETKLCKPCLHYLASEGLVPDGGIPRDG